MNMMNTVQRLRIGGFKAKTIYHYKALLVVGGFLRAGTGGGNLGWTDVPPNEREGLPEEREGVLEEIEGALEGAGGVLMVVPRCSRDLGAVGGGARTSPELNFVSLSPSAGEL